jgi:hypothetical protein
LSELRVSQDNDRNAWADFSESSIAIQYCPCSIRHFDSRCGSIFFPGAFPMRVLTFVSLATISVLLCSCQSSQQREARQDATDNQRCEEMGYSKGTALYLQCRQLQTSNRIAQDHSDDSARDSFGSGLQRAGAALGSISPPPPAIRNTNCNPTAMGGMNCTTF